MVIPDIGPNYESEQSKPRAVPEIDVVRIIVKNLFSGRKDE